jgi:hypothetical protein
MKHCAYSAIIIILAVFSGLMGGQATAADTSQTFNTSNTAILIDAKADPQEVLAAKELRKYLYLRTGQWLDIETTYKVNRHWFIVAEKNREVVKKAVSQQAMQSLSQLAPLGYKLKTENDTKGKTSLSVIGNDPQGTLYGVYRLLEHYDIGFYLHGDSIPDEQISLSFVNVDEVGAPLFELRGILPFHDFPEGPDWWTRQEWKMIIEQTAKMRMNIIALHCYPLGALGPEPLVWIGLKDDINPNGTVKVADKTGWHTTNRYAKYGLYWPTKTSNFHNGAAQLFAADDYGPDTMTAEQMPFPKTNEDACEIFNNVGGMLNDLFTYAKTVGVHSAIGTEAPLHVPDTIKSHIETQTGKPADDPEVVQALYEGMFERIKRTHPLDYYWIWTNENWTWSDKITQEEIDRVLQNYLLAQAALDKLGNPFALGSSGWVLGPQTDRALFDKAFPEKVFMACINRNVGKDFIEPAIGKVTQRPTWAIPWLEDDAGMISPQLWAGRMRRDASDAYRYGCKGLLGLHWRTRLMGPNASALAQAAWDTDLTKVTDPIDVVIGEVEGGESFKIPVETRIAGVEDNALYRAVRTGVKRYRLQVPNGTYSVTLQFNEPLYDKPDMRAFNVDVQGKRVIDALDIFKEVGKNHVLDRTFEAVRVDKGVLNIHFGDVNDKSLIAGIVVDGIADPFNQFPSKPFTRKINCGGMAFGDYEADAAHLQNRTRTLSADGFYRDWARRQFSQDPPVYEAIAEVFGDIDSSLPEPSSWSRGPGAIRVSRISWETEAAKYAFIEQLAAIRDKVTGAGNLERFDYWLNTFRYMKEMAHLGCLRGQLDGVMEQVEKTTDAQAQKKLVLETAMPVRIEMSQTASAMLNYLLQTVTNHSELGTIANIEQQSFYRQELLTGHDKRLVELSGSPIPIEAHLSREYQGPTRIIVPAKRGRLCKGEAFDLQVMILSQQRPTMAELMWRKAGDDLFHAVPLVPVARGVYNIKLNSTQIDGDFEYYLQVIVNNQAYHYPSTAPKTGQVIIVSN